MAAPTLAEVRALRAAGQHAEHLAAARALALAEPTAVEAQIEAAYAHDRADLERDAIRYYDAAHALGIPAAERRVFLVGYGSTLRNVGRADDAVAILGEAIADDPDYPPFHAFLSLALFSAVATMLGVALDASRPDAFDRYARALTEYQRELLADP
jgi:tetratricopeptide (TPR) repeat protein